MSGSATPNLVNMSHWGGPFTDAEAQAQKALGIRGGSPGCGPGSYGALYRQQADTMIRNGMTVIPYHYIEHGRGIAGWFEAGVIQWKNDPVVWVSIDVEDRRSGQAVGWQKVREEIQFCIDRCKRLGKKPMIYTARHVWNELTNHWTGPADQGVPLWDADYDDDPDLGGFIPYGGWTSRIGKQIADTDTIGGQSAQYNVFAELVFGGAPGEEEMSEEFKTLVRLLADHTFGEVTGETGNADAERVANAKAVHAAKPYTSLSEAMVEQTRALSEHANEPHAGNGVPLGKPVIISEVPNE